MGELARDEHGVPHRGSFELQIPTGNDNDQWILQQFGAESQPGWGKIGERWRSPLAVSSGGVSNLFLYEAMPWLSARPGRSRSLRLLYLPSDVWLLSGSFPAWDGNASFLHYFLGTTTTLAVAAVFFTRPPTISIPMGVDTIPRLSLRTSYVSSAIVSHRLACTS